MQNKHDKIGAACGSWKDIKRALEMEPLHEDSPEREVFLAQLAIKGEPKIVEGWYQWRKPEGLAELSAAERLLFVQVERDEAEVVVDRVLEAGGVRSELNSPTAALDRMLSESVAQDLARLYVPWSNPALFKMLDGRENARQAAAWLLALGDDDGLVKWFYECEDEQHALEAARVVGLLGNDLYWDAVTEWRDLAESEGDEQAKAGFHAALACMDPVRYARSVVLGEMEADWIQDARQVADFLQTHGMTDWLETLALFEHVEQEKSGREAFEFAALVALGASAGVQNDIADVELLFEWLELARSGEVALAAEQLSASGSFGFQVALGEDDDLVVLLCEAAIHELLLEMGEGSPGISGLPLSATDLEWVDLEAAEALFAGFGQAVLNDAVQGEALVALVHTLVDLRGWVAREPEQFGELVLQAIARFEQYPNAAVQEACKRLQNTVSIDIDMLKSQGSGEDITGLDSLRQLLVLDTKEATDVLYELWLDGPVARIPSIWTALDMEPRID